MRPSLSKAGRQVWLMVIGAAVAELGTTVSKFRSGNEAARIARRLFPGG